jgi:hypothetical protein
MSLVNASDLDTSPPRWLVGDNSGGKTGMIPEGGTGFAWGRRTSGKSLVFGIELGLAVANGTPFLGRPTARGKVVYCVGEGLYDLGVRKQARLARQARDNALAVTDITREQGSEAAASFGAALPPYTDENLKFITEPFTVPLLSSREKTPSLTQAMATISRLNTPGPDDDPETFEYVKLIILDSLADFTGRSLSNDSSANLITGGLKAMARELECFVLAIAHPTAKGDKMLGADRLLNAADTEIEVAPDDVSAPGAPKTASVICHKSKYGAEFETVGYRIEPCEWDEPELDDETGEPTGETVRVKSATVRLIEENNSSQNSKPRSAAAPLPVLQDPAPARPRRRTGLRPQARNGLHLVADGDLPAVPRATAPAVVPAPGPADAKRELMRTLLAARCPDCDRIQMGCDARMAPQPVPLAKTAAGQSYIHEDRIVAAALLQPDPEAFLERAVATLTKTVPVPAAAAPPAPAVDPLAGRLSWTTVRPDSPAPSLAEIMAGT